MNLRRLKLPAIISFHLCLILLGGYFLSPEFTLYPYLTAHGFLPYREIIDQHFPAILFGPFSLPYLSPSGPQLLIFFLTITGLTDLFLWVYFVRRRLAHPQLWLFLWVLVSFWFSGNTLWLETVITFILAASLLLSTATSLRAVASQGFLLGLATIIRPTLLPVTFYFLIKDRSRQLFWKLAGAITPLLITAIFIVKQRLWLNFLDLSLSFNRDYYLLYARKLASANQVVQTGLVILFFAVVLIIRRQRLQLVIASTAFILIFPRFEFFHLQVSLFLLLAFAASANWRQLNYFIYPLVFTLLLLSLLKIARYHYGNFYLRPEVQAVSQYLLSQPGNTVYVLGGSELIYPLSGRVPPNFTYLPSLPWYFHNPQFTSRMKNALSSSPTTIVVVNPTASIDGVNIVKASGIIGEFIRDNYQLSATISGYQLFTRL